MSCLVAIFALVIPRGLILGLWLFTDWFEGVFDTILWPLLGLVFVPTSLLWYSGVQNWFDGSWGTMQIIVMAVAVLIDISPGRPRSRQG